MGNILRRKSCGCDRNNPPTEPPNNDPSNNDPQASEPTTLFWIESEKIRKGSYCKYYSNSLDDINQPSTSIFSNK